MSRLEDMRARLDDAEQTRWMGEAVPWPTQDIADLLAVAEAAQAFVELEGCEATTLAAVNARDALRTALARLDGAEVPQ